MVASAEAITADSEKYVEQLLQLFRRFSLLVNQVRELIFRRFSLLVNEVRERISLQKIQPPC
jgi:hypothetical protein